MPRFEKSEVAKRSKRSVPVGAGLLWGAARSLGFASLALWLAGCAGPRLLVDSVTIDSFDGTTVTYTVVVRNGEDRSPVDVCRPGPARGPIILQAWSSTTPDLASGNRVQGDARIVFEGEGLAPGETRKVTRRTVNPLNPGRDHYLVLEAFTPAASAGPLEPSMPAANTRCRRVQARKAVLLDYP